MSKIKLTESQITMIQQREKDLAKRKVLKISESQYNSIFKNYDKSEKKMDKSISSLNLESDDTETDKDIDPLTFAQELIVFIKDVITNPRQVPFSKYWEDLDISRGELFRMIKKEGLVTKMTEGDGNTSYSTKKNGFRKAIKKVFNECNKSKQDLSEEDYEINDPRSNPDRDERLVSNHNNYSAIYYNERSEQLALFKDEAGNLYAINGSEIPEEYIGQFCDIDGIVDYEAIAEFVNEIYSNESPDDGVDAMIGGDLVLVTQEIKEHLFEYYGDDIKMVEILNQMPESTTGAGALGSGGPVPGMSNAPTINKELSQHSPSNEMSKLPSSEPELIDEDLAINQYKVTYNLEDNGGDSSPFFDEFHQVQEFMNYLEKKGVVSGVEVSKTNGEGIAKSYIYDFNGSGWDKREENVVETTVAGASADGGSSGPFDVNGFEDSSEFMNAGNKLNKSKTDMPMVKRQIGEGLEQGQVYSNGNGRIRIDKIVQHSPENTEFNDSNYTLKTTSWIGSHKTYPNLAPSQLSGWTLQEHKTFKKVLKLTEAQVRLIAENESTSELASLIQQSINTVDESLNYTEFADAIAHVIQDSYGSHLIEPIMERLRKRLPKQENVLPGIGESFKKKSLVETIRASSVYNDDDSLMSVLKGDRDVSFLLNYTIKKYYNTHIKDNPEVNMLTVPRDGEGVYGDAYIVYRDEAKARHLLSVTAKHEGYLQDTTPEEAIENGEALEYDDNDIKEFTDTQYGVGSYDKIKMKY